MVKETVISKFNQNISIFMKQLNSELKFGHNTNIPISKEYFFKILLFSNIFLLKIIWTRLYAI